VRHAYIPGRALVSESPMYTTKANKFVVHVDSRPSSMDETRRGGDDVTKEDETVMDEDQGNSRSARISL
jgi:hypothetical protein